MKLTIAEAWPLLKIPKKKFRLKININPAKMVELVDEEIVERDLALFKLNERNK